MPAIHLKRSGVPVTFSPPSLGDSEPVVTRPVGGAGRSAGRHAPPSRRARPPPRRSSGSFTCWFAGTSARKLGRTSAPWAFEVGLRQRPARRGGQSGPRGRSAQPGPGVDVARASPMPGSCSPARRSSRTKKPEREGLGHRREGQRCRAGAACRRARPRVAGFSVVRIAMAVSARIGQGRAGHPPSGSGGPSRGRSRRRGAACSDPVSARPMAMAVAIAASWRRAWPRRGRGAGADPRTRHRTAAIRKDRTRSGCQGLSSLASSLRRSVSRPSPARSRCPVWCGTDRRSPSRAGSLRRRPTWTSTVRVST